MRVNVYAEEMTDQVEIIGKAIDGHTFTGLRFHLQLPATVDGKQYRGPLMHRPGDDDSAAVTFWGKRDLREVLRKSITLLDEHYAARASTTVQTPAIGAMWPEQDGFYAGIVRGDGGEPDYHLIVAANEYVDITWDKAMDAARTALPGGFTLPKRKEQAVMFGNVPELFANTWYWSCEQPESTAGSAWYQYFTNGYQYSVLKSLELRARAVRRLVI